MAKIVYKSLRESPGKPLRTRRVTAADGTRHTLYTLDADSPTFSAELTEVFRRNVAKARRDNKRVIRSTGRAAAKP